MARLTGTVDKVFEHRKGTAESGKRWSVQRFMLETEDEKVTCEAWGMRDLEELEGEQVTVTGKMSKETYEGRTYERFKLDAPPKRGGRRDRDQEELPRSQRDRETSIGPANDSWRVHLTRAANLLVKCHEAAESMELTDGEDARTLFIEMKRYIKEMPDKPMARKEDQPAPPEPDETDYGSGPDNDEEPF
jgi:hypothetical protein